MTTRVLFVGAGHAHLEVLRRFGMDETLRREVEAVVISPEDRHVYSGMVPGYFAGRYALDEISVDVPTFAAKVSARFVRGVAVGFDAARQRVRLASGEELEYDLCSFAIGSNTAGVLREGIEEHAFKVKPLSRIEEISRRADALGENERNAVVVGAGAAGFEVALALAARWRWQGWRSNGDRGSRITLVDRGAEILPRVPARLRRLGLAALARNGIELALGAEVERVLADRIVLAGREIPSHLTVWLTGAISWPIFRESGLAVDERGFLSLDRSLRALSDSRVFAAGDCGTLVDFPSTPKAGVYAVREGPVLFESLRATLRGEVLPTYKPQEGFLSLLNTGDGRALFDFHGLVAQGRWAMNLKDRIDRGFLAKYR